jgi:hypothetical protein
VFAAAAYGKETAAFLILLMVAHGAVRRERWFWMQAAACAAIFAVIQVHLSLRFDAPPLVDNFNSLERNLGYLAWYVTFSSWGVVVLFLLATRLAVLWPTIPIGLRLAVLLLPLYLAAALFKGWIEEYRQYGELLLPFGLVAILWMQTDLGNLRRQGRSAPPGRNEPSNRKQS